MEHFSNYHEDRSNQYKISHKVCEEKGYPLLSFTGSQWKLRQQHDQSHVIDVIMQKVIDKGIRSKKLKVNPVKNIHKNLQNYLPVQKEVN